AQHCVIEDIKIYGEAFNVGIQDLPGSGGSTVNVHIIGGNIGIYQDQNRTVPTLIGLVLEEQIQYGIKLTNTQGPLVIAGFKISSTQAPSTDYRAIFLNNQNSNQTDVNGVTVVDHANSNLSLTDGSIEVAGANGVAIRNGRQDLSLVNVYIKANTLIENGVFTAPTSYVQGDENQWKKISQHYYTSILDISSVVVDGQSLNDRTDSYEFTGAITNESPDASIYTKHSYGQIPDFNNPNVVDITDYGATTANIDPDDDDGVAIQLAIDDVTNPTSANYGKTVLIPRGNFGISTPIVVKKGTKLIGTAKNISTIYANNPWSNDNGAIITTVDDANGDIILSDFSILGYPRMCYLRVQSGNTVVRDIMTEDKIRNGWPDTNWETVNGREGTYIDFSNNAGGKVYHVSTDLVVVYDRFYVAGVSNYHLVSVNNTSNPLTIYQISVEHHVFSPKMLVKNAKNLTIFGFKYEGPAELLHIVDSDNIEICGGAGNYFMDREGDQSIIKIINSTNILLRTMSRKTKHGQYIFGRDYPVNDITQFWLTDSGTEVSPYYAILWYQVGNPTTLNTTTIDEWTFTSGATPQVSDTQSITMGNWDPSLAGTSVPSAGILRDATAGNSSSASWGDNLGFATMPDNVVLTVEIADINHTQRDYWFEFLGTVGGATRLDINAFNGGIVIDLWGAGIKHYDGPSKIFDTDDYTGAISLTVSVKWDFANNKIAYTLNGDGVGYTGSGSSAFSDTQTVSANLSAITNISSIRVRGNTVGTDEYIDLDRVALLANVDIFTNSSGDNQWNTASNWASGSVPNSSTNLIISSGQTIEVGSSSTASANNIYVDSGATLTIDPSSSLDISGTLNNNGTIIMQSSATTSAALKAGTIAGSGT
ncbi:MULTISPECIES: glycosyl hydrolase family 28-related protein, partial [Bacteroidota]|uniref:glycosyl hydrolase family 28-related protein n=1 Tax=Polaribacter sp. TaxID=1920175 RepID=UPI0040489115